MILYNIEEYYHDSINKKSRFISTIEYNKPYKLALFIKKLEDLKNKPKGTYHKLKRN